jgi:hypothetical protein
VSRMKAKPIKRQQTALSAAMAAWEKREAERAAVRQRELKQQFLQRRAA